MTNVILCGGNGTRLWPVSRTLMPKQFIPLFNRRSLFQLTITRNLSLADTFCIVSNTEQYFLASDQVEEMNVDIDVRYLLEPVARNTAPAIALAAMFYDPEEILFVTPSDHLIKDVDAYQYAVERAKELAKKGYLVTFGITPTFPEIGYGYIRAQGENVEAFIEKPDKERAKSFLEVNLSTPGTYLWNSGMFCFKAGTYLQELEKYAPAIFEACAEAFKVIKKHGTVCRITHEAMASIPEESIDYAVMEHSDLIRVVPCNIGWSDLGSFDALDEVLPKDKNGNTQNSQLVTRNASNNFIYAKERLVAIADVNDLIVVDTADALLITRKGHSQVIKEIVKELKSKESELPHIHVTAHRPWGTYTVLESADRYKIKRIVVKPGKRLSLQKHYHRSEHWIVVSGTALVTVGEKKQVVRPNESVYIPMGETHRLENPGKIPLILVEAQVGEYTGEDDIVRLEDDYKRN